MFVTSFEFVSLFTSTVSNSLQKLLQFATKKMYYFRAPFDVSLLVLVGMIIAIAFLWSENYGDKTVNHLQNYKNAINQVKHGMYIAILFCVLIIHISSLLIIVKLIMDTYFFCLIQNHHFRTKTFHMISSSDLNC